MCCQAVILKLTLPFFGFGRIEGLLGMFVRWDAIYFLSLSEHGYVYEQQHAFFPLLPLLTRLLSNTGHHVPFSFGLLKRIEFGLAGPCQ